LERGGIEGLGRIKVEHEDLTGDREAAGVIAGVVGRWQGLKGGEWGSVQSGGRKRGETIEAGGGMKGKRRFKVVDSEVPDCDNHSAQEGRREGRGRCS